MKLINRGTLFIMETRRLPQINMERLSKFKVQSGKGEEIPISLLWRSETALFVFVRHFG